MSQKLYLLAHPKRTHKVNGCNTPLEGGEIPFWLTFLEHGEYWPLAVPV